MTLKRRQDNLNALEALLEDKQGLEEDRESEKRSRIASTYHVIETEVTVMTTIPGYTRRNEVRFCNIRSVLKCGSGHIFVQK